MVNMNKKIYKKFIFIKLILKQNFWWILSVLIGLAIIFSFISLTIPWALKQDKTYNIGRGPEQSRFDDFAQMIFHLYFEKGSLQFINTNFFVLGYLTFMNIIYIVKYNFRLKNVFQIKKLNSLIKAKNIKFIPLIFSLLLFIFTIGSILIYDVCYYKNVLNVQKDIFYLDLSKFWIDEFYVVLKLFLHYIFIIGLVYLFIDIFKFGVSKFITLKIVSLISLIVIVLPAILWIVNSSIRPIDSSNETNKTIHFVTLLLNPFDEWYLFYIATMKEFIESYSLENHEHIRYILRIIYSSLGFLYTIYHFVANRGKYE